MKHLVVLTLLVTSFLSALPAADTPEPEFPGLARNMLAGGIKNETDLKNFLLAAPTWTWERKGVAGNSVKFEPNGVATHTEWVGKWTATSSRKVTIRVPNIGLHILTFSDDFKSYKGIWNNNVPFTGKFSK